MSIRLLSLNIWDLPVELPRTRRAWRMQSLLERLPAEDADILLFQESFRPSFRRQLVDALQHHPDHLYTASRWVGPLPMDATGGKFTMSRWPIRVTRFIQTCPVPGRRWDEWVGRKGWLLTEIDTPDGMVLVVNVHLYAGTSPRESRIRALEVHRLVRSLRHHTGPIIVAGDLNMTAEYERVPRGPNAYDIFHDAGFREIADGVTGDLATMNNRNPWARYEPGERPDRRLTQIWLRGPLEPAGPPRLCLHEPPVADHYGLVADVRRTRE